MNATFNIETLRNLVLVGQSGAGKTTLAETLLRLEPVTNGAASKKNSDSLIGLEPEEVSHSIIITPHVCYATWGKYTINLVDCPGHSSFLETTRAVVPAIDGALFCLPATGEVKFESERLWSFLREDRVPTILFANLFEQNEFNIESFIKEAAEAFEIPVQPLNFPVLKDGVLRGVVRISDGQYLELGTQAQEKDLPTELRATFEVWRAKLVERVAETDDTLVEKFLENGTLTDEELDSGLRAAITRGTLLPVVFGSARSIAGLQQLLDLGVDLLPSPEQRGKVRYFEGSDPRDGSKIVLKGDDQEPFSAIVCKTSVDQFSGKLSFIRVVSGHIELHTQFLNASQGTKQKTNHIYRAHGKDLVAVNQLRAGEIGALAKLEETLTCDTLCDAEDQIVYPRTHFADALVSYAVEVDSKADEKISAGLAKVAMEDPTLHFTRDSESHELLLGGMGQTHLEISLERLERKFGGHATLKTPRVPYRETIRKNARVQGKLKKQTGGHGQFANCFIEVEPLPRGSGFIFEDQIAGGVIPRQFIPSVEKGVRDALRKGVLAGYPLVDLKVKLVDGSFHAVDSSDYAFQVAGSLALKAGVQEGQSVLLEPIMSVDIQVPEESTGDVIKDVSSRRGRILGMTARGGRQKIQAEAPMAEMLEYGNILNSLTSGRGVYAMTLHSYREVPAHISDKLLEGSKQGSDAGGAEASAGA